MPGHLPSPGDSSTWVELRDLTAGGWESGVLVPRLLDLWCRARGVEEAALYLRTDTGLKRVAVHGNAPFEVFLKAAAASEFGQLELPGGVLLHGPAALQGNGATAASVPLELLLASVVRSQHLSDQLERRRFQDSYRGVELEALYDVGLAIASTLNLEELCEEVLLRAVSLLDARRGALYLVGGEQYGLNRTIGGEARDSIPVGDLQVDRLLAGAGSASQDVLPGARFPLAVPVEIEGEPRGLLVVADKESRHGVGPFLDTDRRMLSLFANQAAIALENANLHLQAIEKERLEREMELAAEIQRGILPAGVPKVFGFELTGWNRPTRQVGGDYYGFLPLLDGRLGLVVADVTGKGLPAALLVSTLHSAVRLLLDQPELGDDLWTRLNEHIVDASAANKFITMLMVDLEPKTGALRFLNAGHNPGLLVRATGEVVELGSSGVPLGLLPGSVYQSQSLMMRSGDLLCLYSDGITECLSPAEDEFGMLRLAELLQTSDAESLPGLVARIEAAVGEFAEGQPQGDDQTLVLLRRA